MKNNSSCGIRPSLATHSTAKLEEYCHCISCVVKRQLKGRSEGLSTLSYIHIPTRGQDQDVTICLGCRYKE